MEVINQNIVSIENDRKKITKVDHELQLKKLESKKKNQQLIRMKSIINRMNARIEKLEKMNKYLRKNSNSEESKRESIRENCIMEKYKEIQ